MYKFLRDKSVFGRENAGTMVPVPPPGAVTSFNSRTGAVSLLSADITAALGYTPQAALGFTPVQQGGGAGQGTNKVYIGWSGTRLKAQVDSTDIGNIVFDGQLGSYLPLSGGTLTGDVERTAGGSRWSPDYITIGQSQQGLLNAYTLSTIYWLRIRAQNNLWGSPYSELMLGSNGVLTWNGDSLWHAGNDGPGSGLDADTLDGLDSSYFSSVAALLNRVAIAGDTMTGNLNFTGGNGITANGGIIRGQYVQATASMAASAFYLDPDLDGGGLQGYWDVNGMRQYNAAMFALIGGTGPGYYWTTVRPAFAARRDQAIAFLNDPTAATPTVYDVAMVGGNYFFSFKWYNDVSATWEDFGTFINPASGVTSPHFNTSGIISVQGVASSINFGSNTRQMLNLWSTNYGIGIQNNTQYFRSAVQFNWFVGGVHSDTADDPGSGGLHVMRLNSSGSLALRQEVWHTDLSGGNRFYFSTSGATYVAASGSIIFRPNGSGSDLYEISSGALFMRWGSPTVWWRDTDARTFAIHVNSSVAYFMRGNTDDPSWTQITDSYGTARWMAEWDLNTGNLSMAGSLYVYGSAIQGRDITATRGDGTGAIFLGGSTRYLYYDGGTYQMPTAGLTVGGLVKGRAGGRGMGQITLSTGAPSGGADGDIWLRY